MCDQPHPHSHATLPFDLTRRELLAAGAGIAALTRTETARAHDIEVVDKVSDSVYFHEGDLGKGHCNNGWVVFDDYVLVIDANFPSGANQILPKIRALTDKPIRFAFDTHHHGDHAYGNQVWVDNGAIPVAHTGVIDEMKKYETGYYGNKPGRWEESMNRPDVKASKLKPPTVTFPRELYFDDGKRRVELLHLGVAHTHGDAWAWLPKERILFAGDACVNGPYNFVGDGDVEKWVRTLDAAKRLGATVLCPGHGPRGQAVVIDDQRKFFVTLRDKVGGLIKEKKAPEAVRDGVPAIQAEMKADAQIARYVGDFFPAQVQKVYQELTGKTLPGKAVLEARNWHAVQHGCALA
jgi:glyoxylase-like metal-dependent hydrolase (beta-lactamase superfamily II)